MAKNISAAFYMSALTPWGLCSRMGELCQSSRLDSALLIKGGTASVRSGLIKCAAGQASRMGHDVSLALSPLYPGRVQAAFWGRQAVIDAAEPPGIDPRFPTAFEQLLWLGDCFDADMLRPRLGELASLRRASEGSLESSRRMLASASQLKDESRRAAASAADSEKIRRQAQRLAERLFGGSKSGKGEEFAFIFSGCFEPFSPPEDFAKGLELTVLQDEHGGCAPLFLETLYREARLRGRPAAVGYSPFAPYSRIKYLALLESGLAFWHDGGEASFDTNGCRVINARRFTDKARLSVHLPSMRFNKKAARQLLQSAKRHWEQSRLAAMREEAIYAGAIDIERLEAAKERMLAGMGLL